MGYTEKLKKIIDKNNSHLVIGLDTDPKKIPQVFHSYSNPVFEFNRTVIEATSDIAAGYKLNMAFYEALAEKGCNAVRKTILNIPNEMISICDAKRGDIGNTAEKYAQIYLQEYGFDAITINPYMGKDGVTPFLKSKNKLVYLLALTSNEGSRDFQKLKTGNSFLYETVIRKSLSWTENKNIGFVFGANHTKEIFKFTDKRKDVPLLIPGIGAQKNDLSKLMKNLMTELFVINSSRGIIYSASPSSSKDEFKISVREKAIELNEKINSEMNRKKFNHHE